MALPVKFGVSTWLWTSPFSNDSIDPLLSMIAEMGFDAVEIAVEDPSLFDAKKVKKAMEKYKLAAVVCGAFGPSRDLTNSDTSVHENTFRYLEACLKLCLELDTKFVAGPMYAAVGKARLLPPGERKAEWDLAVKKPKEGVRYGSSKKLVQATCLPARKAFIDCSACD